MIPHVCNRPLSIEMKDVTLTGARAMALSPQHVRAPISFSAQVRAGPALIATNCSSTGGVACPKSSLPQQKAVPSSLSAHECIPPLEMDANRNSGVGVGVGVNVGCGVGEGSGELVGVGLGLGAGVAVDVTSETGVGCGASAGCEPRDKMNTSTTATITSITADYRRPHQRAPGHCHLAHLAAP